MPTIIKFGLQIEAGEVIIALVAALQDTSLTMIERHYSRWITEGLEEMVARAVVSMARPSIRTVERAA